MRYSISLCRVTGAVIVLCSLLLASSSGAQQNPNPNLTNPQLQALDQFLDSHPQISADLKKNPALVKDANYVKKHAALADFMRQHPYIEQTISENPGAITKQVKGQEGQEIRPT